MSATESPQELLERLAAERSAPVQPLAFRLAITGGRDHTPDSAEIQALLKLIDELGAVELHHGDCRGADRIAAAAVRRHRPHVRIVAHAADWDALGRVAGPIRNKAMLTNVHALAAFPGGKGTQGCTAEARRQGRPVHWLRELADKLLLDIQSDHL